MKPKKKNLNYKRKELTEEEKENIIAELLPYIKYTALRLAWRLPPQLDIEDLMSVGVVGLLDAIKRHDEAEGSLATFVKYRIKGAMLDELNEYNTVPKSQKKKMDMIKKASLMLQRDSGRMPEDEEIAAAINLTLDEYYEIIHNSRSAAILNIDEFSQKQSNGEEINLEEIIPDNSSSSPLQKLEEIDKRQWLEERINELPKREKLILSLYYWDELTMKEIAVIMEMTEGRVCQLHKKALLWLKAKIQNDDRVKEFT